MARVDRARVLAVAAQLADRDGFAALTLGAVAGELGIKTPSLYVHIDGLDELRRQLGLEGARRLAAVFGDAAVGKRGDDALFAICAAYRDFARRHPGLYAAASIAPSPRDREASELAGAVVTVVIRVLAAYGLDGDDAIHAARALRAALHGFVTLETNGGFGLPLAVDKSFRAMTALLATGLRNRQTAPRSK